MIRTLAVARFCNPGRQALHPSLNTLSFLSLASTQACTHTHTYTYARAFPASSADMLCEMTPFPGLWAALGLSPELTLPGLPGLGLPRSERKGLLWASLRHSQLDLGGSAPSWHHQRECGPRAPPWRGSVFKKFLYQLTRPSKTVTAHITAYLPSLLPSFYDSCIFSFFSLLTFFCLFFFFLKNHLSSYLSLWLLPGAPPTSSYLFS